MNFFYDNFSVFSQIEKSLSEYNWLEDIYIKFKKTELVEKKSHIYFASLRCSRPTHGRVQNLDPPFGPHLDPLEVEFKVKKNGFGEYRSHFRVE